MILQKICEYKEFLTLLLAEQVLTMNRKGNAFLGNTAISE